MQRFKGKRPARYIHFKFCEQYTYFLGICLIVPAVRMLFQIFSRVAPKISENFKIQKKLNIKKSNIENFKKLQIKKPSIFFKCLKFQKNLKFQNVIISKIKKKNLN